MTNKTFKRIAAIDIGTNSIHLVIAETDKPNKIFSIIHKERQLVRLGEGLGTNREYSLKHEAINRTIKQVEQYLIKIKELKVNKVIATTTSAVRSAKNGEKFLSRIKQLGVEITVVSGKEEGELIYSGVKSDPYFIDKSIFIIDIGGGSAEFIAGTGKTPAIVQSLDLGAVRMTSMFLHTDPPTMEQRQKLNAYVKQKINALSKQIKTTGFEVTVGTSGSVFTLMELIARRKNIFFSDEQILLKDLNHKIVTLIALKELTEYLYSIPLSERLEIPNLHSLRADIIMAGASVLINIMEQTDVNELITCESALREGLIARYL